MFFHQLSMKGACTTSGLPVALPLLLTAHGTLTSVATWPCWEDFEYQKSECKLVEAISVQLLGENTLAIADTLVLAPDDNGNLALMFR